MSSRARKAQKPAQKPSRTAARKRLGRPVGQSGEDTRKRILLAARECFARVGYAGATNRDIADAAGITAGALYRHFDSKAEIYLAAVHDGVAELSPGLRAALAKSGSARAGLVELVRFATAGDDASQAKTGFLGAVPVELQRHPELAKQMIADPGEMIVLLEDMVRTGIRGGELSLEQAESVITMAVALLMGLSGYANALGPELGRSAAAGFVALIEGRLFQTPARPRRRSRVITRSTRKRR